MRRTATLVALLSATAIVTAGAGIAAAETTKYKTVYTQFKYKGGSDALFKGEIDSAKSECVGDRKVKLYRKHNGDKKKIGSDKTDNKGKFKIGLDGSPKDGTYFAETDQVSYKSNGDKTVCLDAKSGKVKIS